MAIIKYFYSRSFYDERALRGIFTIDEAEKIVTIWNKEADECNSGMGFFVVPL